MPALILFVLALVGAAVQLLVRRRPRTAVALLDIVLVWQLAVALGVAMILAALAHLFFADQTARSIGWATGSPFQRENAFGDLGIGVIGVLCIWLRGRFWDATVIAASISLLGDAYGHIYEIVVAHDYAVNNAGPILYMDIVVPIVLIALLLARRVAEHRQAAVGAVPSPAL